jgi:hypothetical protein
VEGIGGKLDWKKSDVSEVQQWVRIQRYYILGIMQNIRHYSSLHSKKDSTAKWSCRKDEQKTLLEKARCMKLSAGLPKSFWAEAIN